MRLQHGHAIKKFNNVQFLNWNFQRGGVVLGKIPSMSRHGYFLELHNVTTGLLYKVTLFNNTEGREKVIDNQVNWSSTDASSVLKKGVSWSSKIYY